MDLSKLSTEDLLALKGGDLSKVSTAGLQALKGGAAPEPTYLDAVKGNFKSSMGAAGDLAAGAVRGAGSIGATLMAPYDMARDAMEGKPLLERNKQRREDMTNALGSMGADTASVAFRAGKLGGEIAGTAGVPGVLAKAGQAVNLAPKTVNALRTSGFSTGAPAATTRTGQAADMGIRSAAGAITGGAMTGLANPEDAGIGAGIGGALPGAAKIVGATAEGVGKLAGKALGTGSLSDEVRHLANLARDKWKIDVPVDRIADSKPLNALASSLNYVPLSGRQAVEERMVKQLDTALTTTFGQNSPNVTMALRKAQADLGAKFETTLRNNTVKVDQQFMTELADAANNASRELGSSGASIISKQVDDIIAKAGTGQIDGQAAYNIKRALDRIGGRNSSEAHYAIELKKALMGALDRSLGPTEAAAFKTTREHYGNMLDVEKIAQNGAEGGISVARLANMKNIGNADMQELADIAAQFVKAREGAHGAAQRVGIGAGLTGLGYGLGGVAGGAVGLGAMAGAGRVANMALDSNMARNALMRPAGAPGGIDKLNALAGPAVYQLAPRFGQQ
jgi:hypothetical protein